ncbi:hypothetical protein L204_105349 [Cryptococcus depauperatus]
MLIEGICTVGAVTLQSDIRNRPVHSLTRKRPRVVVESGQAIVSVRESVLGRWVVSSRLDGGDRRRVVYVAPPFGRDVGGVVVRGGAANRHVFAQCLAAQFVEDAAVHASRLISQGARPSP